MPKTNNNHKSTRQEKRAKRQKNRRKMAVHGRRIKRKLGTTKKRPTIDSLP